MGAGGAEDILEGVLVYVAQFVVHHYTGIDITMNIDEDRLVTSGAWQGSPPFDEVFRPLQVG